VSPARSQTPGTYADTSHGNREIPGLPGGAVALASGSLRTHADDERTWEVGQTGNTGEVPEQHRATGSGGGGGKRSGQTEPATAKRVPDARAGKTRSVRWIVAVVHRRQIITYMAPAESSSYLIPLSSSMLS